MFLGKLIQEKLIHKMNTVFNFLSIQYPFYKETLWNFLESIIKTNF